MQLSKKYNNIDGLRAIAAIGIIVLHVFWNGNYIIENREISTFTGYIFNHIIANLLIFVRLFIMISGFGLCCGYYERFKNNQINLNSYYKRRYSKILPFFSLLIIADIAVELLLNKTFSINTLYEAIANMTLAFGLMPTPGMTVIGVGWTLGVIFGFYIIFPFFVWLIWSKKRAWFSLVVALIINYICNTYFLINGLVAKCNTIMWLCYFIAGGLIFLYRDKIGNFMQKHKIIAAIMFVLGLLIAFVAPGNFLGNTLTHLVNTIKYIIGFGMVLCSVLGDDNKILSNRLTKTLSGISMEMYLCHMLVFRVIQKLGLIRLFNSEILSCITACILVLIGAIAFSLVYKFIVGKILKRKVK